MKNHPAEKFRTSARIFHLMMVLILAFSLGAPSVANAQDPAPFTATPLTADSTVTSFKNMPVTQDGLAAVIVKLKGESVASYQGDIPGLAATSPVTTGEPRLNLKSAASKAYLKHLEGKHQNFKRNAAAIPGATIHQDFNVIMNSVSMIIPVDQLKTLSTLPDVEAILPDELQHVQTDNSPQFIGAPTVWKALGGQEKSGEGVIVGVIDTGIWPEHPSFSDPDPSGKPYAPPPAAPSGQPRACEFTGVGSNPGADFACNNKLIAAYRELHTYDALIGPEPGYTSARDNEGHGTHTSSTAAGNANVLASIFGVPRGTVSGVSPRSYVIMYKALGNQGGFSSDLAAAVQQSILDGVNVINYSISGGSSPYSDAVELAFLDAYNAGIFVAASSGNSGPSPETTDHRSPWVTTVAASTENRAFENTATITADGGDSMTLTGASITAGVGPAPVVVPSADPQCNSPFAAGSVAGQIVVCQRGVTGRAEKGYNVLQGGAVGMILYNQSANVTDLETDNHFLPAIHVQFDQGTALVAFIAAHTNVQGTLTAGEKVSAQGDVMASFSSRGGPGQTLGVSKPDITAPGVQILAGAAPGHITPEEGGVADGPVGELFQAIAGTSMSSPHIAGAGALLKALHPEWTPGQIKSAMMTTAWTKVVKEDGATPATPFDDGSGRIDLTKSGDPGLTFDVPALDYVTHMADLWNANYPSVYIPVMPGIMSVQRTAHSTLKQTSTWRISVQRDATDYSVIVQPLLIVRAGKDAKFTIAIDAKKVPLGQTRSAVLWLTEIGGKRVLHMPITFNRKQAPVTLDTSCNPASIVRGAKTNCTIALANTTFTDANVSVVDLVPNGLKVDPKSVTGAKAVLNLITFKGTLAGAEPPDVSIGAGTSPAGYLPLSAFGIGPISGVGDDTVTNFNVPTFMYAGEPYTRLGVGSNGTLIVGGSTGATDATPSNQQFPNAALPNNVLAPFWTDLNPTAGGTISIGVLNDGVNSWIVVDWAGVQEFSTASATNSFEAWIGINGVQDISFAYGNVNGSGDNGLLTVGAENKYGNRGNNYYYNGTGTLPTAGTELVIDSIPGTPGEAHTITFTATGVKVGTWTNYADLTSNLFQGVSTAEFTVEVKK